MVQVQIARYSLSAAALLQRHAPQVGHIHSRYARILNIQTPDGDLLTLQGPGMLQAPCAASLAEAIESRVPHLAPGDLVVQDDQTSAALRLHTVGATLWDGRLLPLTNLTAATLHNTAEKLTRWLSHHAPEQGIAPVLTVLTGAAMPSPLHRRICHALTPMLTSRHVSAASIADMAAQVIGLGEGLTPSGDDLLVGFLAILHLTGYTPTLLHAPTWLDALMANTTDLSAAFLSGAWQGHFSEPMVRLIHALYIGEPDTWQAPAADLAQVGHSSGVDAMVGIAFAAQLLASASTTSRHP